MANVLNSFERPEPGTKDNKFIAGGTVETPSKQSLKTIVLNVNLADISTASTAYVPSFVAGIIKKISTVINGVITTGDAVLTSKIGAVNITDGVITIANSGSAAGDVDTVIPSAANVVAIGDQINITTDGGSTNTVSATISILIELT